MSTTRFNPLITNSTAVRSFALLSKGMISLMTLRLQQDILDSQEQCSRERANANRYKFLVYEGNHTFWPVPFNLCEDFLNSHIVKFVKNPHSDHDCGRFSLGHADDISCKTGTGAKTTGARPPGANTLEGRPFEPRPPGGHDHRHGVSHNMGNRLNPEHMKYPPNFNQTQNFLSPNIPRPVNPRNEPSTFRRRMSSSWEKHRKNLEKKKTLFSITFCNLGKEAEAARHSECTTGCITQAQIMEKELLLSMRLVITHLLDQPKIAYYLIESNVQRGWFIDGCVDIEGNHAGLEQCCDTDNTKKGSGIASFTKNPARSPAKSPRGFKQSLAKRNSRVNIPERRLSWKAAKKNGSLGLNGLTVCIRPMEIDNLFTILARLSKLTKDDELMCTLEDFFDSYGETVLHKQFGNHHYATPLHIICQYHNINLLERCVNRLKNCPFDQDGNHPFHYIGKMKKERLNPEVMKRLAMYAVAFNCSQFLTKIQCTTKLKRYTRFFQMCRFNLPVQLAGSTCMFNFTTSTNLKG